MKGNGEDYTRKMCGIFAILNYGDKNGVFSTQHLNNCFMRGKGRGPEHSILKQESLHTIFGFHRLAINGLNIQSNQPLSFDNISLICNGEIYNYKELYKLLEPHNVQPRSSSDCEVIIHLYKHYGIHQTLNMLDGEFAFILYDKLKNLIYVARDPFGVRPLYFCKSYPKVFDVNVLGIASEIKMLNDIDVFRNQPIYQFHPGKVTELKFDNYGQHPHTVTKWQIVSNNEQQYYTLPSMSVYNYISYAANPKYMFNETIYTYLFNAVSKRVLTSQRPVGCLLSGGLDSSLVAAIACDINYIQNHQLNANIPPIETFSIGLEGSEDILNARIVAEHIQSKHHEVIITEDDFMNAIPEVIEAIESFDTTTVRASIGNYLLGKYISKNSKCKVILNGDGADELCGGYLYMHKCPDALEFDKETRRLLNEIHYFDVLRSDKSISSNGLEPRTPFLDRDFVNMYLSIPPDIRFHPGKKEMEKYLVRNAFKNVLNSRGVPYLPESILFRRKEAFSDGVSKTSRSLYQILQEKIEEKLTEEERGEIIFLPSEALSPTTLEQKYYYSLFNKLYPRQSTNIIPHYWMPKYVNTNDASARTIMDQLGELHLSN